MQVSALTYYCTFGSPMPTRSWNDPNAKYKYGFNGKERDNEINVDGGDYDYGFRIHDSRLGRFLSTDPISAKFPWNSTYAFAENDVIRCIDLDGLEKVIIFGGADLGSSGLSTTMLQIMNEISTYDTENSLGYDVTAYSVAPWNPAMYAAYDYIIKNYKKNESIIIYGYSQGGTAAVQLANLLALNGISVNLMVLVDAALGPLSQPVQIPKNVDQVVNFYQTDKSSILSRGYRAVAQKGNKHTKILNKDMTGGTSGKGSEAHGTMDEDTKKAALLLIKAAMKGVIFNGKNVAKGSEIGSNKNQGSENAFPENTAVSGCQTVISCNSMENKIVKKAP